ncbi:phosphatidylinositol 5-phosphate 4-kinase type-2 gamma isoform X3 [Dromiciops gliroides]|uniref:phosphatidylinositol 5-phosphate 4-kinase type-2 gamma isoform X3 n=1 Tax=Dromiciops gliroides TaxID=33562 RepID=UPI001CC62F94|nr:phosphatidylinositol 5-phosphate 4-kinase type-2 gamma isoform X3 [Dromiciops gliroides]XP_043823281.1 phosphatidylinositol 5-phosphate 4-kinase type-2 gamma isoform X3 [Dromiciops gliroides]XP_043823282.1 phosphatidylinositol 5-phosphate 4-kinase type-2 gamma isoform X3 [Dromiciops gliroides]
MTLRLAPRSRSTITSSTGRTCLVTSSSRSIVPRSSGTFEIGSVLMTKTTRSLLPEVPQVRAKAVMVDSLFPMIELWSSKRFLVRTLLTCIATSLTTTRLELQIPLLFPTNVGVAVAPKDYPYIVKCHGNTLLPQFLGMYRVSVDNEDSYMLVMRNMFSHRLPVHRKYDLKGSLVSREASDKEKVKELPTLKDMDFLNKNQKVYIGEEEKRVFLEKLKRDVEFLVQLKIMDYSLLLGIHDIVRGTEPEEEGPGREEEPEGEGDCGMAGPPALVGSCGTSPEGIGGYIHAHRPLGPGEFESFIDVYAIRSAEGAPQKEVYFMGLIDILTQYDAKKKAAHAAKTVKHGAGAEISTVHPDQYAKRFLDFITNIFA